MQYRPDGHCLGRAAIGSAARRRLRRFGLFLPRAHLGGAISLRIRRNWWKTPAPEVSNPCPVLAARNDRNAQGFASQMEPISMLMTKERRPTIRTLRGWAISVLHEAGAIKECETHGWMQARADPHARQRAFGMP